MWATGQTQTADAFLKPAGREHVFIGGFLRGFSTAFAETTFIKPMKTFTSIHVGLLLTFASSTNLPAQASYTVTERAADYNVLQKTTVENGTNRVHRIVTVATGLNYTNAYGQLVESKEQITILSTGGAQAVQGRHQAYFPPDIYEGPVRIVGPGGLQQQSQPLGLFLDDGAKTVLIAAVTHSVGQLVGSNRILYTNAFVGVDGDIQFTYRRSGVEQDVILRSRPPSVPGLNPATTRLEMVTEFFGTNNPVQKVLPVNRQDGLSDVTLTFGNKMQMVPGRAMFIGADRHKMSRAGVPTYKSWLNVNGRKLLIEAVPLWRIKPALEQLQASADSGPNAYTANSMLGWLSTQRLLPPKREFTQSTNQIQVALVDLNRKPGLLLDYNIVDSDQTGDCRFEANSTYLIAADVYVSGTTTFGQGTVLKFPDDGSGSLDCGGPVVCETTPFNPAVFTSENDDSAGEVLPESNGNPAGQNADYLFVRNNSELKHCRFSYAAAAVVTLGDAEFSDVQFYQCCDGIVPCGDTLVRNALVRDCFALFDAGGNCENVTFDNCAAATDYGDAYFTNCIFSGMANLTNDYWGMGASVNGSHNGFDNSDQVFGDNAVIGSGYQSGPLGNFYLPANSPFINKGSTTADRVELYWWTTQLGGQDIEGTSIVDLGYHYPAVDANGNPISTLENGVPDYISDANGDGLPDSWEMNYFGDLNHSASDQDPNGNTLLYYYQNSLDPNAISFDLSITNNYVNTRVVPVQINLRGGFPFYLAVLVDDTNFADATWTAYASSNLTVNLGATDGWHEIWIGLKGLPDEATKTWVWKRLKLDRTPPLLVITNPVSATVMQPMIELQGYSPEELAAISFDLTNAAGLFTNQQVLVLDRHYDTNTWEFTTNTFQAFDIPLTNGVNTFTLHATDLAGNTTNLTLSYTLDYSGKTNPPVVQLYWPQDGAQICGSSFTWRGRVDDFTAQLTAQIVDANGNTNAVNALVERDGDFWAENLSLSAGANELTLTATDAAGNVSITNITVAQSTVTLIMNDVPSDQLWNATVTVYGSINDANDYTVWVNGVKATLNGDSWEADNVPNTPGGTAVFQARAIPNTDNGGNGSGGSGGASASYTNPGNPDSADAKDADSQTDKPMRLYVESYSYSEHSEIHPSGAGYNSDGQQTYSFQLDDSHTWALNWADGSGGTGSHDNNRDTTLSGTAGGNVSSSTYGAADQWPASVWPDLVDGTGTINTTVTYNGQTLGSSWSGEVDPPHVGENGWPTIAYEHCQEQGSSSGSGSCSDGHGGYITSQDNVTYTRTADTVMKLFTGGKAGSNRQNIFAVSATAQRPLWMSLRPNLLSDLDWWEYELPPLWGLWVNIDSTQITIDNQAQDANGVAYFKWPDGVTKVLTPKTGADYYTFDPPPTAGKYTPVHHVDCVAPGDRNLDRTTLGIGEIVHLSGMPNNTIWSLSGDGTISGTNGPGIDYTAPLHKTSATVYATVGTAEPLPVPFSIIPPSSITVNSFVDHPEFFGTQNPSGTQMGAQTVFTSTINPTSVSFNNVTFRENPEPSSMDVTWPDRTLMTIHFQRNTNGWKMDCGQDQIDDGIQTPGLNPSSLLTGAISDIFSFENSWTIQYQSDAGAWIDFSTRSRKCEYKASNRQAHLIYCSKPGGWQGPY